MPAPKEVIIKEPIGNLKVLLYNLVKEIHRLKAKLKANKRIPNESLAKVQGTLKSTQNLYRIHHIAYCELKGIPRSKVEYHSKQNLGWQEGLIQKAKDKYYCPKKPIMSDVWINLL